MLLLMTGSTDEEVPCAAIEDEDFRECLDEEDELTTGMGFGTQVFPFSI